jgi:catechol 2,3-dioxygenase-like lactoylglutathione lyase family enzyme
MLRPRAVDHVGIIVTDMDRSVRFYQALGIELIRLPRRPGGGAVLKAGKTEINMFCNPEATADGGPQRLDHFCLEMDTATIDEVVAALDTAGIAIASGPVARSNGTALFVHDPDGARIELLVKHER